MSENGKDKSKNGKDKSKNGYLEILNWHVGTVTFVHLWETEVVILGAEAVVDEYPQA